MESLLFPPSWQPPFPEVALLPSGSLSASSTMSPPRHPAGSTQILMRHLGGAFPGVPEAPPGPCWSTSPWPGLVVSFPTGQPLVGVGPCDRRVALVQVRELAPVTCTLFLNILPASHLGASLVAQAAKNPPAMQETCV